MRPLMTLFLLGISIAFGFAPVHAQLDRGSGKRRLLRLPYRSLSHYPSLPRSPLTRLPLIMIGGSASCASRRQQGHLNVTLTRPIELHQHHGLPRSQHERS